MLVEGKGPPAVMVKDCTEDGSTSTITPVSKSRSQIMPINFEEDKTSSKTLQRQKSFVQCADKITVQEVEAALANLKSEDRWLVRPDHSYLQNWDFVIFVALIFTALITPFEVAFVETQLGLLFFVNRFVDMLFITDMVLQFFLMFHNENGRLIKSHKRIRQRYMKGWFVIDFVTVLPFDMAKWVLDPSKVKIIRIIRLLRLFKLLRIVRASRIFARWETKLGIDHGKMMYMKLFCTLTLLTHWFACVWGLFALIESPGTYTWLSKWLDGRHDTGEHCKTFFNDDLPANGAFRDGCWEIDKTYLACFQLAVMTITGAGPGGGIEPVNMAENILISLLILMSGVQWANIIGQICGIAASGDPVLQQFHQIGDDLNRLMRETNMESSMRQHVRLFLRHNKGAMREANRKSILQNLSPELSGQMAIMGQRWIKERMVFWVHCCSPTFLSILIIKMTCEAFAPREMIPANDCMYVLRKGTVMTTRLMMKSSENTCWNVDFILTSPAMANIKSLVTARTLSFVEVDVLSLETFNSIMDIGFPETGDIRKRIRWWAVLRLIQHGAQLKSKGKMPRFNRAPQKMRLQLDGASQPSSSHKNNMQLEESDTGTGTKVEHYSSGTLEQILSKLCSIESRMSAMEHSQVDARSETASELEDIMEKISPRGDMGI